MISREIEIYRLSERARWGYSKIDRKIGRDRERGGDRTARESESERVEGVDRYINKKVRECAGYIKRERRREGDMYGEERSRDIYRE